MIKRTNLTGAKRVSLNEARRKPKKASDKAKVARQAKKTGKGKSKQEWQKIKTKVGTDAFRATQEEIDRYGMAGPCIAQVKAAEYLQGRGKIAKTAKHTTQAQMVLASPKMRRACSAAASIRPKTVYTPKGPVETGTHKPDFEGTAEWNKRYEDAISSSNREKFGKVSSKTGYYALRGKKTKKPIVVGKGK